MDALTIMLSRIRAAGALLGKNLLTPPWSLRFTDGAAMTLVTMMRGEGWVIPDDAAPVRLRTMDIAVVNGPQPFTVTSDPAARPAPLYVLTGSGVCTDEAGNVVAEEDICLGTRTCGSNLGADHALLTGTYATTSRVAQRLLSTLPRVLVVPRQRQSASLAVLEAEIVREEPGQQAVLDRLLDLVLIETLREWLVLSRPTAAPGWHRAVTDPVVGAALSAIHDHPARPWTVETLAREAQVSRATFARQFAAAMGESPIAYLTGWRLCLAADLLEDTEDTVESIARQVGYSTAFALSAAFTRQYDIRPSAHRAALAGAGR